jgi:hypothetical protein
MKRASTILLTAIVCLVGCRSNDRPGNVFDPGEDIDYPDTQIVIVQPRSQRIPPLIVLNRGHGRYLIHSQEEAIPRYEHPAFSRWNAPAWTVVHNADMKVIIEEHEPSGFYRIARPITLAEMAADSWPPKEALVVEKGGQAYVLFNPKERDEAGNLRPLSNSAVQAARSIAEMKHIVAEIIKINPAVVRSQTTERGHFRTRSFPTDE